MCEQALQAEGRTCAKAQRDSKHSLGALMRILDSVSRECDHREAGASEEVVLGGWIGASS